MSTTEGASQEPTRREIQANTSAVPTTSQVTTQVKRADDIRVEDSPTEKYILTPSGCFRIFKKVILIADGHEGELTSTTTTGCPVE